MNVIMEKYPMKMPFKKRYLLIIPIMALIVMLYVMGFFWELAYGFPYGEPTTFKEENTPEFAEVPVDFVHDFNESDSLSLVGSAIIDVDNDGTKELFVGGGKWQNDALLRYSPDRAYTIS